MISEQNKMISFFKICRYSSQTKRLNEIIMLHREVLSSKHAVGYSVKMRNNVLR